MAARSRVAASGTPVVAGMKGSSCSMEMTLACESGDDRDQFSPPGEVVAAPWDPERPRHLVGVLGQRGVE